MCSNRLFIFNPVIIFFICTCLSYTTASFSSVSYHFVTASLIGWGDIWDIRSANLLLKSRLLWGSDIAEIPCTWVIFLDNELNEISKRSLKHAFQISYDSNCPILLSESTNLTSVEEITAVALEDVSFQIQQSHIIFMLPHAVILSDPLESLPSHDGSTVIMHLQHPNVYDGCVLSFFVIPLSLLQIGFQSTPMRNMCDIISNIIRSNSHAQISDLPPTSRLVMHSDSVLDRDLMNYNTNNSVPIGKVVFATSGYGLFWDLFPSYLSQFPESERQYLYTQPDGTSLDCEFALLVHWDTNSPTHDMSPSHSILATSLNELLASKSLSDMCYSLMGTVLYDPPIYKLTGTRNNQHESIRASYRPPYWTRNPLDCAELDDIYKWNGTLDNTEKTQHLLKNTEPQSVVLGSFPWSDINRLNDNAHIQYGNPSSSVRYSNCSIAIFAQGYTHLHLAFQSALRARKLFNRSEFTEGYERICGQSLPLLLLYVDSIVTILNLSTTFYSHGFTLEEFFGIFDGIYETCNTESCMRFIPSENIFFSSLLSASQDQFYHSPMLWWRRTTMLLHPPTRYVLYLDADVMPCHDDFHIEAFSLLDGNYDLAAVNINMFGDTNDNHRFPYPENSLGPGWIEFPERNRAFLLLDTSADAVQQFAITAAVSFLRHIHLMMQGRTVSARYGIDGKSNNMVSNMVSQFVRGDQMLLRQGLFYVREQIRERKLNGDNMVICIRAWRYKPGCMLYHGGDALNVCSLE